MEYWTVREAYRFLELAHEAGADEVVWARVRDMIWVVAFRDRQGLGEGLVQDGQFEVLEEGLEQAAVTFRRTGRDGAYWHRPTLDEDGNVVE